MGKKSKEKTTMETLGGVSQVQSVIYVFEKDISLVDFEKVNASVVEVLEEHGLAGVIPVSTAAYPDDVNLMDLTHFCRITNTNRKV